MSSARKPVIVRKLTREWCAGYAAPNPAGEGRELEMLDSAGKLQWIPWDNIKWVCYVRELLPADGTSGTQSQPERLLRRRFTSRPRIAGLWLRLTLVDGEELEGIAANDRSLLDSTGILLIPPDTRSSTQRIYVPRAAIRDLSILAVVGPAAQGRSFPRTTTGADEIQPELFST